MEENIYRQALNQGLGQKCTILLILFTIGQISNDEFLFYTKQMGVNHGYSFNTPKNILPPDCLAESIQGLTELDEMRKRVERNRYGVLPLHR